MPTFQKLYPRCDNFCRVFQLPDKFPTNYCFGGGIPVGFLMVDWFNPWPEDWDNQPNDWSEVKPGLIEFLQQKNYVKSGREYILITEFGESLMFKGRK